MKKIARSSKPVKVSPVVSVSKASAKSKPNKLLFGIIAVLVVVAGFLLVNIRQESIRNDYRTKLIPNVVKKLVGDPSTKFTVSNLKDVGGLYEFELTLGEGAQAQKYASYISKNGELFFTSGVKTKEVLGNAKTAAGTEQKKLTCADLTKTENSILTPFVVSQCPFGLQMQRLVKKVITEQPELADHIKIRYIGAVSGDTITSMHGEGEATENLKQICIREEQADKYWPYVSCYMQEGKSDECIASAGVDSVKLNGCTTDKTRGVAFAKVDFDLATKLKVSGSPTLILNDKQLVSEFDFGGRVADSLKQLVCCSSKTQGEYCSKELSKTEVATMYSLTDEAPTGTQTNTAAGCATQ